MLDPLLTQSKPIFCYRHKKQLVTHLCTDIRCNNNPILCSQCMNEGINRSYHYDHYEKMVLPIDEAVDSLCQVIRAQNNPIQRIYKSTLGRADYNAIALQLEKGNVLIEELENRITTIKSQVELELQLLVKQFQKILLIQKQQYFRLLETYQRNFVKNIEYLREQTQGILDFQNSVKYFCNKNNFYLKMAAEMNRKGDWVIKTKKTLQMTTKNIESSTYTNELGNILSVGNRIKLDMWPTWKGEDTIQKSNDLKFVIKRAINQWAFIPELKSLEQELENSPQSTQTSNQNLVKNYYIQTHTNVK